MISKLYKDLQVEMEVFRRQTVEVKKNERANALYNCGFVSV